MKKLLLILALSLPVSAQMLRPIVTGAEPASTQNISFIQAACNTNHATGVTVAISPTNGNQVICGVAHYENTITEETVKDQAGNLLTQDATVDVTSASCGGTCRLELYSILNASNITSIVGAWTGTSYVSMACYEVSGVTAFDSAGTGLNNTPAAGTWTTNAVTPAGGNNGLVIGMAYEAAGADTFGATAPYTKRTGGSCNDATNGTTFGMVDQLVTSTSDTYTPNGTISPNRVIVTLAGDYKH